MVLVNSAITNRVSAWLAVFVKEFWKHPSRNLTFRAGLEGRCANFRGVRKPGWAIWSAKGPRVTITVLIFCVCNPRSKVLFARMLLELREDDVNFGSTRAEIA